MCGAAGAAAEARFISSAKVSPAGPSAAGVPSLPSCFSKANFDGVKGVKKSPAASPLAGRGVPSAAGWVSASLPDPAFSLGREKVYSPPRTSAKGKLCSWRGRWSRRSSSGTPCTTTEVRGGEGGGGASLSPAPGRGPGGPARVVRSGFGFGLSPPAAIAASALNALVTSDKVLRGMVTGVNPGEKHHVPPSLGTPIF